MKVKQTLNVYEHPGFNENLLVSCFQQGKSVIRSEKHGGHFIWAELVFYFSSGGGSVIT